MLKDNLEAKTFSFYKAYDGYYDAIAKSLHPGIKILEIGGGAHPSLIDREKVSYTIVDPDKKELEKSPGDILKLNLLLEEVDETQQYELILSKMVLEHVDDPSSFHSKIIGLLNEKGTVIHFFACRHSIPAFVNRLLPEAFGDFILKLLQNRNTNDHPKYPAFYKKTKGGVKSQIKYFEDLGYNVEVYRSYVGHKYFQAIPIFKQIEQLYTWVLVQLQMKSLATVALVVLKKK